MATPFRERNPVPIGAVGLLLIGAMLLLAFNVQKLPVIGRGTTYRAAFTEAGGLKTGDDVLVAGVKIGKVKKIELDGAQVLVTFKVTEPAHFGTRTGAQISSRPCSGRSTSPSTRRAPASSTPTTSSRPAAPSRRTTSSTPSATSPRPRSGSTSRSCRARWTCSPRSSRTARRRSRPRSPA